LSGASGTALENPRERFIDTLKHKLKHSYQT
jgi:hypothetical protein